MGGMHTNYAGIILDDFHIWSIQSRLDTTHTEQ
jgi:hypothetical protein